MGQYEQEEWLLKAKPVSMSRWAPDYCFKTDLEKMANLTFKVMLDLNLSFFII